tara:strand:+ start:2251 stop:2460 length:210 start_codon:yes stop_codon:yes gene_type:complete
MNIKPEDLKSLREDIRSSKVKIKKSKELDVRDKIVKYYLEEESVSSIAKKLELSTMQVYDVLEYCGLEY